MPLRSKSNPHIYGKPCKKRPFSLNNADIMCRWEKFFSGMICNERLDLQLTGNRLSVRKSTAKNAAR
jgi:hypothetical protein